MKAAEGYIGGPEIKSASFLPARRRSGRRTRGRGSILREPNAYASILFALMTTVASAQAPQPAPAAPRRAPGPAAQIHTNLPADSVTLTHWYKQNVYDPADNKIGEIMDVLVDRDGKVTALIVGVGGFLGAGEKDVAVLVNAV